jgi:hypothetical protein
MGRHSHLSVGRGLGSDSRPTMVYHKPAGVMPSETLHF